MAAATVPPPPPSSADTLRRPATPPTTTRVRSLSSPSSPGPSFSPSSPSDTPAAATARDSSFCAVSSSLSPPPPPPPPTSRVRQAALMFERRLSEAGAPHAGPSPSPSSSPSDPFSSSSSSLSGRGGGVDGSARKPGQDRQVLMRANPAFRNDGGGGEGGGGGGGGGGAGGGGDDGVRDFEKQNGDDGRPASRTSSPGEIPFARPHKSPRRSSPTASRMASAELVVNHEKSPIVGVGGIDEAVERMTLNGEDGRSLSTDSHDMPGEREGPHDPDGSRDGNSFAPRRSESSSRDDASAALLASQLSEVGSAIQEIRTLVFQAEEKRHMAADLAAPPPPPPPASLDVAALSTPNAKSSSSFAQDAATPATNEVDVLLMRLDAKLESVSASLASLDSRFAFVLSARPPPSSPPTATATATHDSPRSMRRSSAGSLNSFMTADDDPGELKRKYDEVVAEWESVKGEVDTLKEELKEDKYLMVFKSVGDQADGMMDSLEKAITLCHEFIWQVRRAQRGRSGTPHDSPDNWAWPSEVDSKTSSADFYSLQKSFNAKKHYYAPACESVLAVLDKGVRERATKNGMVLRRFSDMKSRWKNLREKMVRVEGEMRAIEGVLKDKEEQGRSALLSPASSTGSSHLMTPPSSKVSLPSSTPSSGSKPPLRPKSPFRKLVNRGTGPVGGKSASPPPTIPTKNPLRRTSDTLETPTKPLRHRHSQSFNVGESPHGSASSLSPWTGTGTSRAKTPTGLPSSASSDSARPQWNASTRVKYDDPRKSSILQTSPGNSTTSQIRPGSRTSRLIRDFTPPPVSWSAGSFFRQSQPAPAPASDMPDRPPSRNTSSALSIGRPRQSSGSRIPLPAGAPQYLSSSMSEMSPEDIEMLLAEKERELAARPASSMTRRAVSPTGSTSSMGGASRTSTGSRIPRLALPSEGSTPSSPTLSTSSRMRSVSPAFSNASYASSVTTSGRYGISARPLQTPEPQIYARAQRLSMYQGGSPSSRLMQRPPRSTSRPPVTGAPSSASSNYGSPRSVPRSRPTTPSSVASSSVARGPLSRDGTMSPSELSVSGVLEYVPNSQDPLDLEVARIANSQGIRLERVDPPLKGPATASEKGDNQARYMFGNNGKVVMCRFLSLHRPAGVKGTGKAKKVLARVGGGWQDLEVWLLSRQL